MPENPSKPNYLKTNETNVANKLRHYLVVVSIIFIMGRIYYPTNHSLDPRSVLASIPTGPKQRETRVQKASSAPCTLDRLLGYCGVALVLVDEQILK